MCAPKSPPYSKSNSGWPDLSTGIASFSPAAFASAWMFLGAPNCSSTRTPSSSACTSLFSTALTMPS